MITKAFNLLALAVTITLCVSAVAYFYAVPGAFYSFIEAIRL